MNRKRRILAVDDNPENNEIIQEVLGDDYDIRTASTGEEALKMAPDFQPDIILLDVMMPGIDGYETCRQLRQHPRLKKTTVLMVTAKGELEARIKGHEVGADDYMSKPFSGEQLRESVDFFSQ